MKLKLLGLPPEAWRAARLLRSNPSARLILMTACDAIRPGCPAPSVEKQNLMTYLHKPPKAGPQTNQASAGLQNWKRAGRRFVQIGGVVPTATSLYEVFKRIYADT